MSSSLSEFQQHGHQRRKPQVQQWPLCGQDPEQAVSGKKTRRRRKVKNVIAKNCQDESLCRYKNKLCATPRAQKRRGGLHTFCEYHREAANRYQRRLEMRKRVRKREMDTDTVHFDSLDDTASSSSPPPPLHIPVVPAMVYPRTSCRDDTPPASAPALEREQPGDRIDLEPTSSPVALSEEDISTLRWFFSVSSPTSKQEFVQLSTVSAQPPASIIPSWLNWR